MILSVGPIKNLKGSIFLPSSKSYSIRAVIISACGGTSRIKNLSSCDDVKSAICVAKYLGSSVISFSKTDYFVKANFSKEKKSFIVNVNESGTVLRFVLPLLALKNNKSQVFGEGTLCSRPNHFLTKVLREMGRDVKGKGIKETVPISIEGGCLKGGQVSIDGSLSSQFISALLIAAPFLKNDLQLFIKGKTFVSQTYIEMTINVLEKAGVLVRRVSRNCFLVKANQEFKGLKNFVVPSDYGLAAFLLAAGALVSSDISLKGFLDSSLIQADGKIMDFLKIMGVKISRTKSSLQLKGPFILNGGSFSLKDCPDLLPIMSILALFAQKKTRLYGIEHARIKESDRIGDLKKELMKIGAKITEKKGEIIIYPQKEYRKNVLLDPHHDHRLAMSFCVLGLKVGARVKDIECINKSYPGFLSDFRKLGAKIDKI
ncbi:MAG: 3-phosphoshikimate 1-carboxyvinyltransferase [Candidatus Omnitrophica bacterium]|nr:3-phosphoshikimate 1-carboxyvinyltransferase [Candidatus Omnitrophota bacterium]